MQRAAQVIQESCRGVPQFLQRVLPSHVCCDQRSFSCRLNMQIDEFLGARKDEFVSGLSVMAAKWPEHQDFSQFIPHLPRRVPVSLLQKVRGRCAWPRAVLAWHLLRPLLLKTCPCDAARRTH